MPKRLLFYDLETSGLDKSFDQVLQFAAVVTDENLQELNRFEWWVKLNPDIWPSPAALAVSKITLSQLNKLGASEFQVISDIHELFNRPNTISLGYNTLRFDDEFLRFSFFRNLLEPYRHQYAEGCYRMDIYPMVVLAHVVRPKLLKFPYVDNKISMRLELLREANNIKVAGAAHNALSDVLATIEVAKLLRLDAEFWSWAAGFFVKEVDQQRIYDASEVVAASSLKVVSWVGGFFGAAHNFLATTCFLGKHQHYTNQTLWLRLDLEPLNDGLITQSKFILRKRLGEPPFALSGVSNKEASALIEANLKYLQHGGLMKWQRYWLPYKYPWIVHLDVDAAIYQQGFLDVAAWRSAWSWLQAVKSNSAKEIITLYKHKLLASQQQQAIRILGRNFPQKLSVLPIDFKQHWEHYLQEALFGAPKFNFCGGTRRSAAEFYQECTDNTLALTLQQRQELQQLYLTRQATGTLL